MVIVTSSEGLVCSTEDTAFGVGCGVRPRLEKQMPKAGDSWENRTAFLLFLKIVIKTVMYNSASPQPGPESPEAGRASVSVKHVTAWKGYVYSESSVIK